MTLAVLVLGPSGGMALAQHGNPRFPVNVTLGPVSPPPGASFTPKYPGEFKATPPPGLHATVSPKATLTPTTKVKHKMSKPSVAPKPTTTVKHKTHKPSASAYPSTARRPMYDAAYVPMTHVKPSNYPVVPTVSIKPRVRTLAR